MARGGQRIARPTKLVLLAIATKSSDAEGTRSEGRFEWYANISVAANA
jgi:hypothetical protein